MEFEGRRRRRGRNPLPYDSPARRIEGDCAAGRSRRRKPRKEAGEIEAATLDDRIRKVQDDVVGWRRHLHRNPELSFREKETSRFVHDTLQSFGRLELSRLTPTSVVARLVGDRPGLTIALRADMDALPITEENDSEFVSRNPGVMHACGHDGHTAMLQGTARLLSGMKDEISGEVRFLFQHAEETFPGGAEEMVRAGAMEGVDAVIGIHLWSGLPAGKVGIVHGPMMASPDTFKISINGDGGHAAMPHQTVDAIAIGAQVVTNLQHVVSREIDPTENVVVSVTKFVGGTTHNVIPGTVEMTGTVRTLKPEVRDRVPEIMERIVDGITSAHGASYSFEYQRGYRPVINDEEVIGVVERTARETLGDKAVEIMSANMGGEDFSAFQQVAPGAFFLVGAGNEEEGVVYPHHHPRFTIDESALPVGVRMFVRAAFELLAAKSAGEQGRAKKGVGATSSGAG